MSIALGSRLGPYEIVKPLGAGGMGEVYEAKDTRLDRTVAVKVLPEHLSNDPERRERFEREARAVSSLNHPHICTLFEFDRHDGIDFIVMEYIEGETLADRLQKGPLGLERALDYAAQIADALDKAHRQGVVHRDLKPGNIMITKPGVKLLDFGLARLRRGFGEEARTSRRRQKPSRSPKRGPLSERCSTCRPSSWRAATRMRGATSSRSARCFTRCSRVKKRSRARAGRV